MERLKGKLLEILNEQDFCFTPAEMRVVEKALRRFNAYEDTGLEPEEVQKLADAKKEGRLVVLPWAVGQTIYEAAPDHGVVKHTLSRAVWVMASTAVDDSGNTWPDFWCSEDESLAHMTRAEAEAALEAQKGETYETDSV